jgi:hypothetical protein
VRCQLLAVPCGSGSIGSGAYMRCGGQTMMTRLHHKQQGEEVSTIICRGTKAGKDTACSAVDGIGEQSCLQERYYIAHPCPVLVRPQCTVLCNSLLRSAQCSYLARERAPPTIGVWVVLQIWTLSICTPRIYSQLQPLTSISETLPIAACGPAAGSRSSPSRGVPARQGRRRRLRAARSRHI